MTSDTHRAAHWLEKLVAFDTRNGIGEEEPCAEFLKQALGAHNPDTLILETVTRTRERSDGAYVLATWGQPKVLLNVHLDTVPSGDGWTSDPHVLRREGDRLIGLGASDIKGAIACILALLDDTLPKDVAILFSGDEEQGSEVMSAVLDRGHHGGVPRAIVCEPTGCEVGRRHRGFISYAMHFSGAGGHSSLADHTEAPVRDAAYMAAALGDYGKGHIDFGPPAYKGLCVNIGMIDSDGSHNVIPTRAEMRFSLRPPPGDDMSKRVSNIERIAADIAPAGKLSPMTAFPPFGTRDLSGFAPYFSGQEQAPIDLPYWTEAAMLSDAGIDAVVYGPGDVGQAHKPNEYVTLDHLAKAMKVYKRALEGA